MSNKASATLVLDDISQYAYKSWDELFSMSRQETEDFQLRSARRRFELMVPKIVALKDQAEQNDVNRIDALDDLVPVLFSHSAYKSYPLSLLEENRFDLMTKWLQRLTSVDLSNIDTSDCQGIDDWMATLEAGTPLEIFHTTGTTGRLSFLPRTTLELKIWYDVYLAGFAGFSNEHGVKLGGADGARMPVIFPSERHGRYLAQRFVKLLSEVVAPTPEECYTLNNGMLRADLVSLAGRLRVAEKKGELSDFKISDRQRLQLKDYQEEMKRRPQEMAEFFGHLFDKLRGQRVFLSAPTPFLVQAAGEGLPHGIKNMFAPNSVAMTGGGGKGMELPSNWLEMIREFTGVRNWSCAYAMSELTGIMHACPDGYYHIAPYIVPFLLDPQSDALLPRKGRQTGRFAALDLLAQNYWGGILTGDKVTIEWDRQCPCGRKGAHLHQTVERI